MGNLKKGSWTIQVSAGRKKEVGLFLYISASNPEGLLMLTNTGWEPRALAQRMPDDILISDDRAAELMTQLWDAGIRPARSTGPKKTVDTVIDYAMDEIHYLRGLTGRLLDKIPPQVDALELGSIRQTHILKSEKP